MMQKDARAKEAPAISCPQQESCSGCQLLGIPYESQLDSKKQQLAQLLTSHGLTLPSGIQTYSAGPAQLRDRLDFSLENKNLGLYHKEKKEIVDLPQCLQLSPALQEWLTDFRQILHSTDWPFKKGSLRLRVGPQGQRGVWLDFANVDIKTLLEEKTILQRLQQQAFVEIGQRRKVPVWNGQDFKLRDPELNVWYQTWMNQQAVNLYCQVASFTQPSLKANKIIGSILSEWIASFPQSRIIEFGSGIGNLTFPVLFAADSLLACEIDQLSLQGLQKSLQELPASLQHLRQKIQIHRGDFQKKLLQDFSLFDGVLANPPRSGLQNFLNPLSELAPNQRPRFFIYMSCFPESMAGDLGKLKNSGYEIDRLCVMDQFPQTQHYEVLALLQRKEF